MPYVGLRAQQADLYVLATSVYPIGFTIHRREETSTSDPRIILKFENKEPESTEM